MARESANRRDQEVTAKIAHASRAVGLSRSTSETVSALKEITELALSSGRTRDAVNTMCTALQNVDPEIRRLAASCLGRLLSGGRKNALEALCHQLQHEEWQLIKSPWVISALGALGDPKAIDCLLRHRREDRDSTYALYQALSEIPDPRSVQFLLSRLATGDSYNQRCYAALAAAVAKYPSKIDTGALQTLAALTDVTWADVYEHDIANRKIETDKVRELALQEIQRRRH